jgi:hypothetical protein
MDGPDHEDAEEHVAVAVLWREGGDEAADAGDEEEDTEDDGGCF